LSFNSFSLIDWSRQFRRALPHVRDRNALQAPDAA
jgi:hypothetical protein